jgi:hypothetical protein
VSAAACAAGITGATHGARQIKPGAAASLDAGLGAPDAPTPRRRGATSARRTQLHAVGVQRL